MYDNPIRDDGFFIPITIEEIDSLCAELNIDLPDFMKEFWVRYNGATPLRNTYGDDQTMPCFLIFTDLPNEHPRKFHCVKNWYLKNRNQEELLHADYLMPFASTMTGAYLFVSLLPSEMGYVYESDWGDDELELISTNFVDFINNLQLYNEEEDV